MRALSALLSYLVLNCAKLQCSKALVEDGGGDLDLYVTEIFGKYEFGILLENSSEICNDCTEDNGCIVAHGFYIESECDNLFGIFFRTEYDSSTGTICVNTYQDGECTILKESCFSRWPVEQCSTSNIEIDRIEVHQATRLWNWCIQSSTPQEGFVVPMIRTKSFPDVDTCKNMNMTDVTRSVLLPSSSKSCFREVVDTFPNYAMVPGSARAYCDGNVLVGELYSDQNCSSRTDPAEPIIPQYNASDICTNPLLTYFNESQRGVVAYCGLQKIYCKEFTNFVRFASEVPGVAGPTTPPVAEFTEAPSTSTSGAPILFMTYLIELMAVLTLSYLIPY